jgi:uncharacterized coiled-coil protein SlyX
LAEIKRNPANWDAAVISDIRYGYRQGGVEMQDGLLSRIIDRAVANARAIRGAPEGIVLVVLMGIGISGFGFQHYRERLADLNERLASQDRLLTEYRTKLTDAGTQIEKLTAALADVEKRLRAAMAMPRSVEDRSRDPESLYEDNSAIAKVQGPKIDLDQKRITFPAVDSVNLLQTNKLYEFQNWKLACGGTRLYNMISDGASREFSYSPLTCKIVGSR